MERVRSIGMMTSGGKRKSAPEGADKDREVYWSGRGQAIRMTTEVPVLLRKTPLFDHLQTTERSTGPGSGGHFPGREKQGRFSRSPQGRFYGGPGNGPPIWAPWPERIKR